MNFTRLPDELILHVMQFTDDLYGLLFVRKELCILVQPLYNRRVTDKRLTRVLQCLQLVQQNYIYTRWLRLLSPGIYRCRDPAADYDHLLIELDVYKSFIREQAEFEDGMFSEGVVHTDSGSTRGMLSFDRFCN